MTTFSDREVVCAICGTQQECRFLASTNAFGPPDLDTRPPEMARSAHLRMLMTCASCGYCAPDLEETPDGLSPSDALEELGDGPPSNLELQWLTWAHVNEVAEDYAEAGWAYLRAAWTCDDSGDPVAAAKHRKKAARRFLSARENGQAYAQDDLSERLIRADVLRRAGEFDEASEELPEDSPVDEKLLQAVLTFEQELISKKDSDGYTVADAQDESNPAR